MPIFKKNNRVGFYIHIPKTAGSSVTKLLRNIKCEVALDGGRIEDTKLFDGILKNSNLMKCIHNHSPCNPQHIDKELYRCLVDHSKVDFNFTIVRNPEERIISEYFWVKQRYSLSAKYASGISTYDKTKWVTTANFHEWLINAKNCYDEDPYVWDNHFRKQTDFILSDTKIFRFDQLSKLTNYLNESLETSYEPLSIPHLNRRRSGSNEINIGDEDKELIRNWYKDDYELYHSLED